MEKQKRKAIIFVRILPVEIYFCGYENIRDYRTRTLEIYCYRHDIEIILACYMISEYQNFQKDILIRLQYEKANLIGEAGVFLLHDHFELAENHGGWFYTMQIQKLGLEVIYIRDFAVSIGRY